MRIVRSFLSVTVGLLIFIGIVRMMSALTGSLQANGSGMNVLMVSLAWTVGAALVAGFTCARLGGSHEMPHAATLGLCMIGLSFVSMRQEGIVRPGWYQITIAGCGPISAMIGAAIRILTKGRQATNR